MTKQFNKGDRVCDDFRKPAMEILGLRKNGKYLCLVTAADDITTAEFDGESLEIVESMRRHEPPTTPVQPSSWFFSADDNPGWGVRLAEVVRFNTESDADGNQIMVATLRDSNKIAISEPDVAARFVAALRSFSEQSTHVRSKG